MFGRISRPPTGGKPGGRTASFRLLADVGSPSSQRNTSYQETRQLMRNVRADRHHDGLTGRIGPRPWRHRIAKATSQILDGLRPSAHRRGQWPGQVVAFVIEVDDRWAGCAARDDTSGPSQARPAVCRDRPGKSRRRERPSRVWRGLPPRWRSPLPPSSHSSPWYPGPATP
jgi:hypothetical protein